jgi:hypothetical protein
MHEPPRTTGGQRRAPADADRATPDQDHALRVDGTLRPDHRDPGAPGWPAATGWPVLSDASGAGAPRHIRIEVDRDALVDEVVAYVTAPGSPEHRRRALTELASKRTLWIPRDLLYQQVLDGVTRRADVEAVIDFTVAEHDLIARRAGAAPGA